MKKLSSVFGISILYTVLFADIAYFAENYFNLSKQMLAALLTVPAILLAILIYKITESKLAKRVLYCVLCEILFWVITLWGIRLFYLALLIPTLI